MRINEILTESQHLEEGPILNKIGSAVGKAAGGVAKGVGALAGGIAGIGAAAKKGFAAGKKTVAGADDEEPAAANTANAQPAGAGQAAPAASAPAQAAPAASAPAQAAPAQAAPAVSAPAQTGSTFSNLATAAAGGAPAAPAGGGTQYAQVKANIDKLDKKGKQRILGLLQKELGNAPAKPAADPGAGAMGQMAGQLAKGGAAKPNTMANAPVSKTNTAKPSNPNAAPTAPKGNYDGNTGEPISDKGRADAASAAAFDASPKGKALKAKWDAEDKAAGGAAPATEKPGFLKTATDKIQDKNKNKKSAKPSQAEIDADRERIMGVTSDSIIRTRPMMAESFSLFRKK